MTSFLPALMQGGSWARMPLGGGTISVVVTAVAWLMFAFGTDRVVARTSGTVALVVLAVWPVLSMIGWAIRVSSGAVDDAAVAPWWTSVRIADALVPVAAAIVVAVDVLHSRRVPDGLRRAPLVATALCVVPAVVLQLALAAQGTSTRVDVPLIAALSALTSLCRLVALIGIGVVAIVAGSQSRRVPESIRVFPPPQGPGSA